MRWIFVALAIALALPVHAQSFGQGKSVGLGADAETQAFVTSNLIATFYHELGHALIDVLALPVLGREEDAADILSTLLVDQLWEEESAVAMTFDSANAFLLYAAEDAAGGVEIPYWDEHSLDMQRYFNLACLFYGAHPATRGSIVTELELPQDRADGCEAEFDLAAASWEVMLEDLTPAPNAKGLRLVGADAKDPIAVILAGEIASLNAVYSLPEWIDIHVEACGEANAFYDPEARSITMCTEYAADLARIAATAE
ncbi:MAG: DUF4344 domain-containing metallopeptidase [Paracoccaceae bacterium]